MKLIFTLCICINIMLAWDGYDYDSGNYVEIDKGNLVRSGNEIEYYDYANGEYKYGEVQNIEDNGSSVDIEIIDQDTGKTRIFEMNK
jgi:hypothetical protein